MSARYVDAVVLSDCFSHCFYVFDMLDAFVLATSSEPDMKIKVGQFCALSFSTELLSIA